MTHTEHITEEEKEIPKEDERKRVKKSKFKLIESSKAEIFTNEELVDKKEEATTWHSGERFSDLPLHARLQSGIKDMNYD